MQLWFLFAAIFSSIEGRHYYNYPYRSYHPQQTTTVQPSYLHRSINDVTVVDQKTGIQYNPYSKHHPGRHVCTLYRNVTYPVHTKRVFCKPTYKKYMVRCGNQWCEGVRLVYEKYHKEMVDSANHTVVDYTCCPGWTQVDYRSHGCNKPVCVPPCENGGNCVKPDVCVCLQGYDGTYCENRVSTYVPTPCLPPCQNGGSCVQSKCICSPGFQGQSCEKDVNECKVYKPCDQICHNTHGSFKCDCKEDFILDKDGRSCSSEMNEPGKEVRDLNEDRLFKIEQRIKELEKVIKNKANCECKKDLEDICRKLNKMKKEIEVLDSKSRDSCNQINKSETKIGNRPCLTEDSSNIRVSSTENEPQLSTCASSSSQRECERDFPEQWRTSRRSKIYPIGSSSKTSARSRSSDCGITTNKKASRGSVSCREKSSCIKNANNEDSYSKLEDRTDKKPVKQPCLYIKSSCCCTTQQPENCKIMTCNNSELTVPICRKCNRICVYPTYPTCNPAPPCGTILKCPSNNEPRCRSTSTSTTWECY